MRFLRRLFRRAPEKGAPRPDPDWRPDPATDDWRAGDLAQCVMPAGSCWRKRAGTEAFGPQLGEVRIIARVEHDPTGSGARLYFRRWQSRGFDSVAFVKITPRADRAERGEAASLGELLGKPAAPPKIPAPERQDA